NRPAPPVSQGPVSLKLGPLAGQRRPLVPIVLIMIALGGLAVGGNYLFGPYFGSSFDYSSPQSTIHAWAGAVKSANPKALAACYSEATKPGVIGQDQTNLESSLKQLNKNLIKLDIIDSKITGRTARVIVTIVGRGSDGVVRSQAEEIALVQESSQWKLDADDPNQPPTIVGIMSQPRNSSVAIDPFSANAQSSGNYGHDFQISRADESTDVDNPQFATGPEDGRYATIRSGGELVLEMSKDRYFHNGSGPDIRVYAKTAGNPQFQVWVKSADRERWVEADSGRDAGGLVDLAGLNLTRADSIKIRNTGRALLYVDAVEVFYIDEIH